MIPKIKKVWKVGAMAFTGVMVALVGLWMVKVTYSQPPEPPLVELLLQEGDFAHHEFEREWVEQDEKEVAEFIGLPLDYPEGQAVYFLVYSPPEPKAVVQALYRYSNDKETLSHYEHLLKALPLTPLGRETPITYMAEQSYGGMKGQIFEAKDPVGTAYWFVGTQGKLMMVMVVLGTEATGQPLFEELLPKTVEKMARSR